MNRKALIFLAVGLAGFFWIKKSHAKDQPLAANFGMSSPKGSGWDGKSSGGGYYVAEPVEAEETDEPALSFNPGIKVPDSPQIYQPPPEAIQAVQEAENGTGDLLLEPRRFTGMLGTRNYGVL